MLVELNIKNFALIQELSVEFGAGFNILSGETGAEGRTPGRKQTVSAISDPRRLCRF